MPDFCPVLIAGCGVSGKAAARLSSFLHLKYAVLDEKDTPELREFLRTLPNPPVAVFAPWKNTDPLPMRFGTAVLSPGIRRTNPLFQTILNASDRIVGELEFARSAAPDCPLVCITGTNGKTTTTELTTALFRAVGERADAAGNIGAGLSDSIIAFKKGELTRLIVEVSSFQLENASSFPCETAAVLNLASDHIDRHGSMAEYARIKFILANSASKAVVLNANLEHERTAFLHNSVPVTTFSASRQNDGFTLSEQNEICYKNHVVFDASTARIKGRHNVENMMAALALLACVKGDAVLDDPRVAEALRDFVPDKHRVECFLERNGIRFVDDSKATNPHAVNAALDLFAEPGKQNILILLGGLDKDMDFNELLPHLAPVRKAYLAGLCRDRILDALKTRCDCAVCASFDAAVEQMCRDAVSGDVVLLSPATASMDEFKNYKERGERFKSVVRRTLGAE